VLGHDHRRQHVIGADAEAQQRACRDQHPDVAAERLRQRRDGHQRHVDTVETLASGVGKHTEHDGTHCRGQQRAGHQQGRLQASEAIHAEAVQHHRQHHADRDQVVAIGEHTHAGGDDRARVEAREALLVEHVQRARIRCRHGGSSQVVCPSLRVIDDSSHLACPNLHGGVFTKSYRAHATWGELHVRRLRI